MRKLDLDTGGPGGPYGGYYVWSQDIGYGVAFSEPDDIHGAVARLLDVAEQRLAEPCVMGTITERIVNNMELDIFGNVVPVPEPKRKRKTRATRVAEQEGWY